jgi:hypothetical protein
MPASRQEFVVIYDEFRDAELNKEYYADRIKATRQRLRRVDIYLALFSGSSGVAGFALWSYTIFGIQVGQVLLGVFTGIATIVLLARPYLKLEDEVERVSGIQSTYAAMSHVLKDVVVRIKTDENVGTDAKVSYRVIRQIRGALQEKEDKPADRGLITVKQKEINERYPVEWFYYPDGEAIDKNDNGD